MRSTAAPSTEPIHNAPSTLANAVTTLTRQARDRQRRALAIHELHHATLGCQPYRIVVADHDRTDMPAGNALGLAVVAQHAPIAQYEYAIGIGAHPKIAAPVQRQAKHREASPGWRDHRYRHDAPVRQHPVQAGGSGDPQTAVGADPDTAFGVLAQADDAPGRQAATGRQMLHAVRPDPQQPLVFAAQPQIAVATLQHRGEVALPRHPMHQLGALALQAIQLIARNHPHRAVRCAIRPCQPR